MQMTPGHDIADVHMHVMAHFIFIWVEVERLSLGHTLK